MNIFKSIHHAGYLAKNIKKSCIDFELQGYKITKEIVYDNIRDVEICFLEFDGYCIELVSPKSSNSVVYELLKKKGEGLYHICYLVDNIDESSLLLREQGYFPLGDKEIAPAIQNNFVAFFYKKNIGIIEILENSR